MVMLSGKYSFEYGLIFRQIRKVYPTIIKWKTKRLDFHGNIFFFFLGDIFRHSFIWVFSRKSFIQDGDQFQEDVLSRCFYEREYRFFPSPFVRFSIRIAIRFFYFFFFFFNHISFLLSQARFSQLNAAWLIRPFLHSSCPTKRSFQPSSLSLSALFTSTTFTATHDQNVREKKKIKKITRQRPVHLDDIQKKK